MNSAGAGFLAGFLGDQADKISTRKEDAREYFNEQLKLAQTRAAELRKANAEKLDTALTTANQLRAIGVPDRTIMAIANQNPADLATYYETIQDAKLRGVSFDAPGAYDAMLQIDSDFNPGNENITSLLKKIYIPLSNNIKADPEGFKFDPKGTIWATMMGYNAMENAMDRLESTEVIGGHSAADILRMDEAALSHPLGDSVVTVNAGRMGEEIKKAKDEGDLTTYEYKAVTDLFNSYVDEERMKMADDPEFAKLSPREQMEIAKPIAAERMREVPNADRVPAISQYWDAEPTGEAGSGLLDAPAGEVAPPPEAAVEGSESVSGDNPFPSDMLPSGSKFIKDNGDGTSDWKKADGSVVT